MRERESILADTSTSTPLRADQRIRHPTSNNKSLLIDYFSLGDTNHGLDVFVPQIVPSFV
jgi:hypothetical protein